MTSILGPMARTHPEHLAIAGRLVLGYGELEYWLAISLIPLLDQRRAFRLLFRIRGELARLKAADVILRDPLQKIGLGELYLETWNALEVCRRIRNQYAHAHWQVDKGKLLFGSMEKDQEFDENHLSWEFVPITVEVLKEQDAYFEYVRALLRHLGGEISHAVGGVSHRNPRPAQLAAPAFDAA